MLFKLKPLKSQVSIIVPNYNKFNFLAQTVNSVLQQSYTNWELIIVDDCSTDGSVHLINEFSKSDARITAILNDKNKGGNACRNQGLAASKGLYVLFLDADDVLAPHCLAQRIQAAQEQPENDLWVFPMGLFKQQLGDLSTDRNWIPPANGSNFLHLFITHQLPWQTMQPLWKKETLLALNGFDLDFVRLQDVELFTRALIHGVRVTTFPQLPADCFFRIDDERFEHQTYRFLKGFMTGAVQYYKKFYSILSTPQQKNALSGTLLEPLSNVCFQKRLKKISTQEYVELRNQIIRVCKSNKHRFYLYTYAQLERLSPIHPKGLKKITALLMGL